MGKWEYEFGREVPVLTILENCTLEEVFEALDSIIEHPDFPPGSNLIVDLTRAATRREHGETQEIAHHLGRHYEEGRLGPLLVFVVAKPHQYGLVRQGSVFTEKHGLDLVPCYDFQEALKWVSRGCPDFEGP